MRSRALVTAGIKQAGSLSGWLGAFTLLLRELGLRLCEREEYPTPHVTDLNAGPTCGAAGRPGLWDEPEQHQKPRDGSHMGHEGNSMVLMTVDDVVSML